MGWIGRYRSRLLLFATYSACMCTYMVADTLEWFPLLPELHPVMELVLVASQNTSLLLFKCVSIGLATVSDYAGGWAVAMSCLGPECCLAGSESFFLYGTSSCYLFASWHRLSIYFKSPFKNKQVWKHVFVWSKLHVLSLTRISARCF